MFVIASLLLCFMPKRSIITPTSAWMSFCVKSVARPFNLSCVIVLRKYVLSSLIEDADRSQVQLVTGSTASSLKIMLMLGNDTGFVALRVSEMLVGTSFSGHLSHVDSQLSTSCVMCDLSGISS